MKERLELTETAQHVLEKRYLAKDDQGQVVETPEEMLWRVARNVAQADRLYDPSVDTEKVAREFYGLMANLEFLPNSPTLMNAGRELQQLSACFVLPLEDSMQEIFETVKNAALIHQSGGGTGFSFSRLRPAQDVVKSTGGTASGPISFLKVFNAATEVIKQGGTRRGANMGILRVDHPDILEFITCKQDNESLNNFNISVALTDDFMRAVEKDDSYPLVNPRNGEVVKTMSARKVFDLIVHSAWESGEPGIVFLDRINEANPTPQLGQIESTNPCGEQPLLPFESCNLGSVNLSRMVREKGVDWKHLERVVRAAVHFLDNVVDVNKYPLPDIERMTKGNRKIGLGVMGFADLLIRLGIAYDSEEALSCGEEIMGFVQKTARAASEELARKRGVSPNFSGSVHDVEGGPRLRNATLTTIAPTGSLSIIAGCSSGIEPLFAVCYVRRHILGGEEWMEVHPLFEEMARGRGFYSNELIQAICRRGTLDETPEVPQDIRRLFVTAHDIATEWHVRMQAAFQKHTDNAVSKTVNLPNRSTPKDVARVYHLAYANRLKGVTIYRDGSRTKQVLNVARHGRPSEGRGEGPPIRDGEIGPRRRPRTTPGRTTRVRTGCGDLYVTINEDGEGKPFEVFSSMGKAGGCEGSQTEATSRLISLALRCGIASSSIVKQLVGIRCNKPIGMGPSKIHSCSDAIAKVMLEYLKDRGIEEPSGENPSGLGRRKSEVCPDCGCEMEFSEGCLKCSFCGYSQCG